MNDKSVNYSCWENGPSVIDIHQAMVIGFPNDIDVNYNSIVLLFDLGIIYSFLYQSNDGLWYFSTAYCNNRRWGFIGFDFSITTHLANNVFVLCRAIVDTNNRIGAEADFDTIDVLNSNFDNLGEKYHLTT